MSLGRSGTLVLVGIVEDVVVFVGVVVRVVRVGYCFLDIVERS